MTSAELEIESIAAGGDGVGRTQGVVVFVPRSAPGDLLRARIEPHKRFARGEIEALLTSSPERTAPDCPHYVTDDCGGCQLQHMRYEFQLSAKQRIVRDSLARIGKRRVDLPEIESSPRRWRYRRKLTLTMRRSGDDWVIGLRPYNRPDEIFQLLECPITDERVLAVWSEVRAARRLLPDDDELRGAVQIGDGSVSVLVRGGHAWPNRTPFFEAVPSATALWWQPTHRVRALVASRGGATGSETSASFAQVNEEVGAALRAYVLDKARSHQPATIIDAYAGAGSTAIPLAVGGARVTAIEADRDAAAACGHGLAPFSESRSLASRVEDVIEKSLPADVVLLNPPRVGVHERVTAALAALPPRAIVYVSCDPGTLARDVARLPSFRIASLRAFDMFPQTAHVETVCELVPESATP